MSDSQPRDASPTSPIDISIVGQEPSESADVSVLIIGGGPHALAVLSALHEKSFLFPQFASETMFDKRVGKSLRKVGSVAVLDPGANFIDGWNRRFEALEIKHLRSPAFAHPQAFEPAALVHFAIREGRVDELLNVPDWSKVAATEDTSTQEPLLRGLPSTALFCDFCASLGAKLPHQWLCGKATQVRQDKSTGRFRVGYASHRGAAASVVADAVILATGPTGQRNVPAPFVPFVELGRVMHTEQLLADGRSIPRQFAGIPRGMRVLVVGGGLTAAQAALAAVAAGSRVVLSSRRPLQTRAYDIGGDWLDQRHTNRLRSEFFAAPMEERIQKVKEVVQGGSVPESYMADLRRLARTTDKLKLRVDEDLDSSVVSDVEGTLHVDGEPFDQIILATGSSNNPAHSALYQQVAAEFGAPTSDWFPRVDGSLRWVDGEDVFVVGANAVLELGPGALNLMGAMRGAKIVAEALRDLMWDAEDGQVSAKVHGNMYALLGDGESDSGNDSEEDEPEAPATTASQAAMLAASQAAAAKKAAKKAGPATKKKKKASKRNRGRSSA